MWLLPHVDDYDYILLTIKQKPTRGYMDIMSLNEIKPTEKGREHKTNRHFTACRLENKQFLKVCHGEGIFTSFCEKLRCINYTLIVFFTMTITQLVYYVRERKDIIPLMLPCW